MQEVGKDDIRLLIFKWNRWCTLNNLMRTCFEYKPNACLVTCSDSDIKQIWKSQTQISNINVRDILPSLFHTTINIQTIFKETMACCLC